MAALYCIPDGLLKDVGQAALPESPLDYSPPGSQALTAFRYNHPCDISLTSSSRKVEASFTSAPEFASPSRELITSITHPSH